MDLFSNSSIIKYNNLERNRGQHIHDWYQTFILLIYLMTIKIAIFRAAIHIGYDVLHYSYHAYYSLQKKKKTDILIVVIYFKLCYYWIFLFEKEIYKFLLCVYIFYYCLVFFRQQKPRYLSSVSKKKHAKILSNIAFFL